MSSGPNASDQRPKLILHVDIRNTLFAADSIGHLLVEQGVNSYLTGVAWGIIDPLSDTWQLISDKPSLKPPCADAVTYYKYLERKANARTSIERAKLRLAAANFVDEPQGISFKPVFAKCLEMLKWPYQRDDSITVQGLDGQSYHYIFKSFLNLIQHLTNNQRDFAVILRTFGIDAEGTLLAFESTLNKLHPDFPSGLGQVAMCNEVFKLRRERDDRGLESMYIVNRDRNVVCNNETEILRWMCEASGIMAIKDDFHYWQGQDFDSTAGKPFWLHSPLPQMTSSGKRCYHMIFDDNIRTWEADSIVNFRRASGGMFENLAVEEIIQLEHVCYEQVDLIEAVCDPQYFIRIAKQCEENIERYYTNK